MNYRKGIRDSPRALAAPTGPDRPSDRPLERPGRPESLDKPSRVTFLARSRSTEAPRGSREAILVAPGGAPTLENHAPVHTRTQFPKKHAFALGKALEPLLDSLWEAQGRSWGTLGPPRGALGAPWAALGALLRHSGRALRCSLGALGAPLGPPEGSRPLPGPILGGF